LLGHDTGEFLKKYALFKDKFNGKAGYHNRWPGNNTRFWWGANLSFQESPNQMWLGDSLWL